MQVCCSRWALKGQVKIKSCSRLCCIWWHWWVKILVENKGQVKIKSCSRLCCIWWHWWVKILVENSDTGLDIQSCWPGLPACGLWLRKFARLSLGVLARINLLTLKRHVGTDSLKACWCYYEMSLALPCTGFKFKWISLMMWLFLFLLDSSKSHQESRVIVW